MVPEPLLEAERDGDPITHRWIGVRARRLELEQLDRVRGSPASESGLTCGVPTWSRPGVGGAAQQAVGGEGPLQPGPRAEMPATRDVLNRTHPQSSTMRAG